MALFPFNYCPFFPQSLAPIMDLYLTVLIRTLLGLLWVLLLVKGWARLSSKHCHLSHPPPSQQEKSNEICSPVTFPASQELFSWPCALYLWSAAPFQPPSLLSCFLTSLPSPILDDFPFSCTVFFVQCIIKEPVRCSGRLKSRFKNHGGLTEELVSYLHPVSFAVTLPLFFSCS